MSVKLERRTKVLDSPQCERKPRETLLRYPGLRRPPALHELVDPKLRNSRCGRPQGKSGSLWFHRRVSHTP